MLPESMSADPSKATSVEPERPAERRTHAAEGAARGYVDVWSRTGAKYRVRAVLLLVLNFGLFCGLCIFTHWLHVARTIDFSWESYVGPAALSGERTQNLNDFVLYPINVQTTPIHAVVLGLLMASIVGVPIVISILYRTVCALPFVAAVLVFGHLPWMALTLLLSCVLASMRPFRMSFRFGSALVGLIPVLVYLFMATRASPEQIGLMSTPMQRSLLIAPWLLAIVATSGMMGLVLVISRAVDYRPGAVAPVMAVMFAPPLLLFYTIVGADELAYRVIEAEYGPRSSRFEPVRDAGQEIRALVHGAQRSTFDELLPEIWGGRLDALKRQIRDQVAHSLLADRAEAYEACQFFLADHPRSRYVSNVLFIQARALDTRLHERRLSQAPPTRELYFDFPHAQSEPVWTALFREHPASPLRVAAGLRLAQLQLRRGQIDRAIQTLDAVLESPVALSASQPTGLVFASGRLDPGFDFDATSYRREAEWLRELIVLNRGDPHFGDEALVALAGLDPRRRLFGEQLLSLAERTPGGLLYDNLMAMWADTIGDARQREGVLSALAQRLRPADDRVADGWAQVMMRLAEIELRAQDTLDGREARQRGIERLRELAQRFPDIRWGRAARERLAHLAPVALETAVGP